MFGKLPLCIIRYPTGRYGFVGTVPAVLAYRGSEEDIRNALQVGPGMARNIAKNNGRVFEKLSWASEAETRAAAADAGYTVQE